MSIFLFISERGSKAIKIILGLRNFWKKIFLYEPEKSSISYIRQIKSINLSVKSKILSKWSKNFVLVFKPKTPGLI